MKLLLTWLYLPLATNFKKCSKNDAGFQACLVNSANHGISQLTKAFPELNIPNVDPLEVPVLNIGSGTKGVVAVEQKYKNCKVTGISKLKFDKLE